MARVLGTPSVPQPAARAVKAELGSHGPSSSASSGCMELLQEQPAGTSIAVAVGSGGSLVHNLVPNITQS